MALNAKALTTVAVMEDVLGLTAGEKTTSLERLIHAASDAAIAYCGRKFHYESGITERHKGYGDYRLVLKRSPIERITRMTLRDIDGSSVITFDSNSYEIEDAEAGIVYRPGVIVGSEIPHRGYGWPDTSQLGGGIRQGPRPLTERRAIEVTYTGGWRTAHQVAAVADGGLGLTGDRDLPYDIEQAVISSIVSVFHNEARDSTIASKNTTEVGVTFRNPNELIGTGPHILTAEARSTLDPYKRAWLE